MSVEISLENDTLDLIAYRVYGYVDADLLKALYAMNPEIAALGPILPARTQVKLIDTPPTPVSVKIQLYD